MNNYNPPRFQNLLTRTLSFLFIFLWLYSIRAQDAALSMRDPVKTFISFDQFDSVRFGTCPRPDNLLRGGEAIRESPTSLWISGDYGAIKGRNYLEAGVSWGFLSRKNSRYPLKITIPINMAVGEEEYFLGPGFAYVSGGVNIRTPLPFIRSRFGRWTAGSDIELCYFGTTTTELARSVGLQLPKITAVFSLEL